MVDRVHRDRRAGLAYLGSTSPSARWPSSRVYPWTFLSPVVAILIEAIRGNLPGPVPTVGMAIVVVGLVVVNLPAAEAPALPAVAPSPR